MSVSLAEGEADSEGGVDGDAVVALGEAAADVRVGEGEAVGRGDFVGRGDAAGLDSALDSGVASEVGSTVDDGVGVGVGGGVGVGVPPPPPPPPPPPETLGVTADEGDDATEDPTALVATTVKV